MMQVSAGYEGRDQVWTISNPTDEVRALEAREAEFAARGGFCMIWNEVDHVKVKAKNGAARAFATALEDIVRRSAPTPATARQIEYALDLLARHDEPLIGGGIEKPAPARIRQMDRTEISGLIDALRRDIYQGVD